VYGDWSPDWVVAAHPVISASYNLLHWVCPSVNIYIPFGVELWYVLVHTSAKQGIPLTVSVKVWWVSLEGEV
jgi:hypothetical protein